MKACRFAGVFLLCLGHVFLAGAAVRGATTEETGDAAEHENPQGESSQSTDSLDQLLDIADKDVGQLSQVRVAGLTGSESLDMPVSTVSRQESTVGQSPAAIFVITNDMIRRSGAKAVPEVLRMVPGLEVAKVNSSTWAVTSRGFNGRLANKLLVQIDGRTVYSPSFTGVFWDVQDLLLEDVERIEVIRGPGGTLWGANAVNGIINVITKSSKDTQGTYVESGVGTYEQGFAAARYGGQVGRDLSYRVYGKWFERDGGYLPDEPVNDAWRQARGGFRLDWDASSDDQITLQGDYYNGYSGDQSVFAAFQGGQINAVSPYNTIQNGTTYVTGENINLQWKRDLGEDSDWAIRAYYDRTLDIWRDYGYLNECRTFDFDFQHRFPLALRHQFIWGLGVRNARSIAASSSPPLQIDPTERSDNILSCFAQDQIALSEDLWYLTLGTKMEHNDYTGLEFEPSVRLLWTPDEKRSIWGAISRAVRTPAHVEVSSLCILPAVSVPPESALPIYPFMDARAGLQSEEVIAYELGYREQTTEQFSWDLALFINRYERLIGTVPGTPYPVAALNPYLVLPLAYTNAQSGNVYGAELAATCTISPTWRLRGAYTYLLMDLDPITGLGTEAQANGDVPCNQLYLQSGWDLGRNWELDLIGRYVDSLRTPGVSSYITGDARLAWRYTENLEFSVVGRNLLAGTRAEFGNDQLLGMLHTMVEPEVYGQLSWRY